MGNVLGGVVNPVQRPESICNSIFGSSEIEFLTFSCGGGYIIDWSNFEAFSFLCRVFHEVRVVNGINGINVGEEFLE